MADLSRDELQERLQRLEEKVEYLEQQVGSEASGHKAKPSDGSQKPAGDPSDPQKTGAGWQAKNMQLGEEWLNRIGIGLLLIGVAFLFKYSIDQGWLIPPVRSAIGLAIGLGLFGSGLQMSEKMSPLKQILLGGGIAVFYVTGFATFQLYSFIPGAVVWAFMVTVTLLALSLSLEQDEAVLSVVGTLGALGTPFMLYGGGGNVVLLVAYIALVLAGTVTVYMKKGWKTLLWSITSGGALVLFVGIFTTTYDNEPATSFEHWALQFGVLLWMTGTWLLPVYREVLAKQEPSLWPIPSLKSMDGHSGYRTSTSIHLMIFIVPLLLLVMTIALWDLSMGRAGIAAMVLAALGSVLYLPLKDRGLPTLASSNGFLGLTMLTIGFVLVFEGNFLFVILAAEAVALRFVAFQTGDAKVGGSSHFLFAIVGLWVISTLYYSLGDPVAMWDIETLTQLGVIAAGGILIPNWLQKRNTTEIYQGISHVVMLLWLYQKFAVGDNGQSWVTIMWALYAVVLLIVGFMRNAEKMRITAMATIFVVVGKLLIVDLSQMEAIWRILMFMSFGLVFLLLGYYWQSRLSSDEK